MNHMNLKLGQSAFQDTFFVVGAQLTPYRQLRQIELELGELANSIKKTEINLKRQEIKLSKLNLDDPLESLDAEELEIDKEQTLRLLKDAKAREANFQLMKQQLLENTPDEYWEKSFEECEFENWSKYFAKQLQISILTGVPNPQLIEQISTLPEQMVKQIMIEGKAQAQQFLLLDKSTTE